MVPLSRDLVVLVVDDNVGMRSIMTAVLRALGFGSIRLADDAIEAQKMILQVKPDLIITDLGVIEVTPAGLVLREAAHGVSIDEIVSTTGCPLDTSALAPAAAR